MADFQPLRLNGGEIENFGSGDTVPVTAGGTGATTATQARTNLALAIGTNVQAWDADLDALAALATPFRFVPLPVQQLALLLPMVTVYQATRP